MAQTKSAKGRLNPNPITNKKNAAAMNTYPK